MKFTKEQFLETLKTKNTAEKLLSDKTVQGMEALYGFAGEDEEMDAFVERISPLIKTFEGQVRKMNSDHFKEKQEWEKAHPKEEPKPKEPQEPNDKLDALLKEIGELKKEREAEKAAKAVSDKRDALKAALKGKNVKNDDWINDQLELVAINADTDIDSLTERLVKSYNKFGANTPSSITPQGAGGAPENTAHQFDDIVEALKE